MTIFNTQPVIDILSELASSSRLGAKQIDEAIDALEQIKIALNVEDDEAIDKVDEIQDYLQYLLATKEVIMDEVQEEITTMISELQVWGKW